MTRLYHHKTDGGAEYLCNAPIEGTNEGDLRTAVVRLDGEPELIIEHLEKPAYVFVSGGTVDACLNAQGEPVAMARIIDYDNERHGMCPVCGSDGLIDIDTENDHNICSICGYDQSKDNALECAVAYFDKESK